MDLQWDYEEGGEKKKDDDAVGNVTKSVENITVAQVSADLVFGEKEEERKVLMMKM